jgi:hypothetical protein
VADTRKDVETSEEYPFNRLDAFVEFLQEQLAA